MKNIGKKVARMLFALCMFVALGVVSPSAKVKAETLKEGDYEYRIWEIEKGDIDYVEGEDNRRASITGYTGTATELTIPSRVCGIQVVSINAGAFSSNITSIEIPSDITYIAGGLFDGGCNNLNTITVDEDNSIYYSEENCIIEKESKILILGCSKSKIPEGVTSIGDRAFAGCDKLESITIPSSMTSVSGRAFIDCSNLNSITVDKNNSVYYSEENCIIGKENKTLIRGCNNSTIPAEVTNIGDGAFWGCCNLTNITIPSSIIGISYGAFRDCRNLTSITIPASVKYISLDMFVNCSNLKSIIVDENNSIYYSEGNCIIEKESKTLIQGCDSSKIPDGVKCIGRRAFSYVGLIEVTIPDSVTTIEEAAFSYCDGLKNISIPKSVTRIDRGAFYKCSSLTSIIIPGSVATIEAGLFLGCSSLTSIELSDGLTSLGNAAFMDCNSLTSITIPDSVTIIENEAFRGCSSLKSIKLSNNLTILGTYMYASGLYSGGVFEDCSSLTSITIPDSVRSIGDFVFCDCSSLINITIPEGVTSIGAFAFYDCSGLTSVTIPSSVTSIGEDAFMMTTESYKDDDGEERVLATDCIDMVVYAEPGSYAEQWAQRKEYTLEVNLSNEKCKVRTLSNDTSNPTVTYIGTTDESATIIEVPDTVTINGVTYKVVSIADNAFSGNKNITKVDIGKNVASIGKEAFSDCPSLGEVVLPEALKTVSPDVFEETVEADSEKDLKVTIPEGAEDVSKAGIEKIINIQYVTIYVPEGSKTEIYLKQFEYLVIITYPPTQPSTGNKENEQKEEAAKTTEQVTEAPKEQPEIGKKYTVNNLTYKVTSSKYVTFVGTSKKSLKTLTIPAKVTILGQSLEVTAIEKRAMKKCSKLTTVVIGSNVKTIGDEAFMNCSHLKKITIGKNVKTIGKKAFSDDKKLTKIIFKGAKVSKIGKKALYKVPKKVAIKAPKKVTKKYAKLLNGTRK